MECRRTWRTAKPRDSPHTSPSLLPFRRCGRRSQTFRPPEAPFPRYSIPSKFGRTHCAVTKPSHSERANRLLNLASSLAASEPSTEAAQYFRVKMKRAVEELALTEADPRLDIIRDRSAELRAAAGQLAEESKDSRERSRLLIKKMKQLAEEIEAEAKRAHSLRQ